MDRKIRLSQSLQRLASSYVFTKLAAALGLLLVLTGGFAYIAKQVYEGDTLTRDTEILLKINSHSSSLLDTLALGVTYTGNMLSVIIIASLLSIWLYKNARIRAAIQIIFAVGGAIAANALLKLLFQRERPELWQLITHESTYSFPSGHALITAALAVSIALIWRKSKFRWMLFAAAATYALSVGISRLYLGVHYPTDVLAGWCFGAAWAIAVAYILSRAAKNREQVTSKQ